MGGNAANNIFPAEVLWTTVSHSQVCEDGSSARYDELAGPKVDDIFMDNGISVLGEENIEGRSIVITGRDGSMLACATVRPRAVIVLPGEPSIPPQFLFDFCEPRELSHPLKSGLK